MSTVQQPGLVPQLPHQRGARTVLRVVGSILFPLGLALLGYGFFRFVTLNPNHWGGGLPDGVPIFLTGLVTAPVGWLCLGAGFVGTAARYGAGEIMPTMTSSWDHLNDTSGTTDSTPGA